MSQTHKRGISAESEDGSLSLSPLYTAHSVDTASLRPIWTSRAELKLCCEEGPQQRPDPWAGRSHPLTFSPFDPKNDQSLVIKWKDQHVLAFILQPHTYISPPMSNGGEMLQRWHFMHQNVNYQFPIVLQLCWLIVKHINSVETKQKRELWKPLLQRNVSDTFHVKVTILSFYTEKTPEPLSINQCIESMCQS